MDGYQFAYSIYHRRLRQPLHTSHGLWAVRTGIIVRLIDRVSGRSQAGEIAPIHWFGSESIADAIEWCRSIGDNLTISQIHQIPDTLPACQFGCGSAAISFDSPLVTSASIPTLSALLPTGAAAIDAWQALSAQGYSTFKWKIGVAPIAQEVAIWRQLLAALPASAKLRLDANGGLTYAQAVEWLEQCDREPRIEFIEQPLAPDLIPAIIDLARTFSTPIALDESVATFDRLQAVYQQGWRGIYVIKPGIAGFPWRLTRFITQHQLDVVFSSVLETSVGRSNAFELAAGLNLNRAMGFGVENWFEDEQALQSQGI
jgi:o-succinylbenzoate synthase